MYWMYINAFKHLNKLKVSNISLSTCYWWIQWYNRSFFYKIPWRKTMKSNTIHFDWIHVKDFYRDSQQTFSVTVSILQSCVGAKYYSYLHVEFIVTPSICIILCMFNVGSTDHFWKAKLYLGEQFWLFFRNGVLYLFLLATFLLFKSLCLLHNQKLGS